MTKSPDGFVSLKKLKQGSGSPRETLAEIRQIYFKTTRQTIEHDFAHAIDLLKSLEHEEDREKATVYMQGLTEMRKEWGTKKEEKGKRGKGKATSKD